MFNKGSHLGVGAMPGRWPNLEMALQAAEDEAMSHHSRTGDTVEIVVHEEGRQYRHNYQAGIKP